MSIFPAGQESEQLQIFFVAVSFFLAQTSRQMLQELSLFLCALWDIFALHVYL